jgi:16S rRNA (cytosine1402-N4)-methyltransferase
MATSPHISVLLSEVIDLLEVRAGGVYVDATCGAGGHAEAICAAAAPNGRLVALDADPDALELAKKRLSPFGESVTFVNENFTGLTGVLDSLKIEKIDGALADLGVSSMQMDRADRGFSFGSDVPLDMRMNPTKGETAEELLIRLTETELARVIGEYGEQPKAARIARTIKEAIAQGETITGKKLRELVHSALPAKWIRTARTEPATRVFMAIRIAVNDELAALESFLTQAVDRLAPGAKLAVISFHSLEDRIVKWAFRDMAKGCVCPKDMPICGCGKKPIVKIITRKPVAATQAERDGNPRSRSAKLRVAQKLDFELPE